MTEPLPRPDHDSARRLPELDVLRGIAAIAVTLFHFTFFVAEMFPGTPRAQLQLAYGWYGVQLFFAISGFVILMTLDRTARPRDFARARFWRLMPTYWLAMVITFVAMHAFGPARLQTTGGEFALNLTMLQLYLQPFVDVRMVDGAYWSLNVEIIFYAVLLLLWRLRLLGRIEHVLIGWIALKWVALSLPEVLHRLLLLDHIAFFAIGILAYRIWSGQRTLTQQLPALAVAVGTVFVTDTPDKYPLVVGLALLFWAVATGRLGWLTWRPLVWFGTISYPLYLLHGYIGYATILRLTAAGVSADVAAWTAFAIIVALAAAVVYGFERPLHAAVRRRKMSPRRLTVRFATPN